MKRNGRTFAIAMACMAAGIVAGAEEKLPKLVDLGAHQCIPCKRMAPILEELKTEYADRFEVEFIDVWKPENKKRAEEYGIKMIPTQIFLSAEGKELWRHEGFLSKEAILEKWQELGVDQRPDKKLVERWDPAIKELEPRCGFCDRSVYPRDAAPVKVGPGLHTWGCCPPVIQASNIPWCEFSKINWRRL